MSGRVPPCTPRSYAISSSRPVTRRPAARRGPHTPTISRAIAMKSGAGSSRPRRPMPALSPAGTREGRRCAQAPQKRSDDRAARQGLHLTPCSSPRGHPCATGGYLRWPQKALVDHITRLRVLGLGAGVVDVLDGEIELVFVVLRVAAIFGAAVGQHATEPHLVLIVEGHHAVVVMPPPAMACHPRHGDGATRPAGLFRGRPRTGRPSILARW